MPKFNLTVPFTQGWKNAILESIARRRIDPYPSALDCAACDFNRKANDVSIINCELCSIDETTDMKKRSSRYGWCGTYSIGMWRGNVFEENPEKRAAYLDKMEKAVNRRKVVKCQTQ